MSAFWCVFWWVLLGFLLGWLCHWLLQYWLSGDDDDNASTVYRKTTPAPSTGSESSGMNWQTQMVDRSGSLPSATSTSTSASGGVSYSSSSAIAAASRDEHADTDTHAGTINVISNNNDSGNNGNKVDDRLIAETQNDADSDAAHVSDASGVVARDDTDGDKATDSDTVQASALGAASLFASEKHNQGKTFAAIDNGAEREGGDVAASAEETQQAAADEPAPVFAAVVNVDDSATSVDLTQSKVAQQDAKEQTSVVMPVVLSLVAAKEAGFSIRSESDLTVVEGIGPKISRLFKDAGIYTLAELSQTPTERMQEILDAAGSRYRLADPTTWAKQAGMAARNNWAELKAYQDTLDGGRLM